MINFERFYIRNEIWKTYPNIIHAQNIRIPKIKKLFDLICENSLSSVEKSVENNLQIVTATNNKNTSNLFSYMEKSNHKNFSIIGKEIKEWDFICKISLLKNFLEKVKTKYFLFCDSHDVIPIKINGIVEKFLSLNSDAIFNAEYTFWPDSTEFNRHNSCNYPNFILVEEKEKNLSFLNPPMFLNSGLWIAKTDFAIEIVNMFDFNFYKQFLFEHNQKILPQDQTYYRDVFHATYPKTTLDYKSILFQTLVSEKWDYESEKWKDVVQIQKKLTYRHTAREIN
jgi:hypothetical protein